tara:strand:- start:114 stop:965 length:852 start_codon:yes stop_codon:yes gene_type:complete
MGSVIPQAVVRGAPLLIGGGITASQTNPEDLKSVGSGILSSMIGSPATEAISEMGKVKDQSIRDGNVEKGTEILEGAGMSKENAKKVSEKLFGEEEDAYLSEDEIKDRIQSGGMGEEILGQIQKDKSGSKLNLEEGEDKGKVIDLEEKKKQIKDSDPDPDDKDSGDLITSIQQIEELVKENQKLEKEGDASRRKENTKKIIFDQILPDNVLTTARQEINNRDGSKPFVKEDFRFIDKDGNSSFATDEQLAKIQKDFNSLIGKVTTLKKTGGMVDKAISYEPRY